MKSFLSDAKELLIIRSHVLSDEMSREVSLYGFRIKDTLWYSARKLQVAIIEFQISILEVIT